MVQIAVTVRLKNVDPKTIKNTIEVDPLFENLNVGRDIRVTATTISLGGAKIAETNNVLSDIETICKSSIHTLESKIDKLLLNAMPQWREGRENTVSQYDIGEFLVTNVSNDIVFNLKETLDRKLESWKSETIAHKIIKEAKTWSERILLTSSATVPSTQELRKEVKIVPKLNLWRTISDHKGPIWDITDDCPFELSYKGQKETRVVDYEDIKSMLQQIKRSDITEEQAEHAVTEAVRDFVRQTTDRGICDEYLKEIAMEHANSLNRRRVRKEKNKLQISGSKSNIYRLTNTSLGGRGRYVNVFDKIYGKGKWEAV